MSMQQDIERFALAQLRIERAHASHQKPDPRDMAIVQDGLALARRVPPEVASQLGDHVADAKLGLLGQERQVVERQQQAQQHALNDRQQRAASLAQSLRDTAAKGVTRQLTDTGKGLTQAQYQQARASGKYIDRTPTLTGKLKAAAAASGKTEADIKRAREALGELIDPASPGNMERFLDKQGVTDLADRALVAREMRSRYFTNELKLRREEEALKRDPKAFAPREIALDSRDRRRLDVIDAASRVMPDDELIETLSDRVEDRSLRDEGVRGDIARAVYEHSGEAADDSIDYDEVEAIAEGRA